MSIGCVIVSRNDNYGGNLKERAAYSINSCLATYDEVVFVDYNSRDKTLVEEIESNLFRTGKLLVVKVTNEQHREFTKSWENPQPCSEVLGRNIGIRRLNTDFIVSTNVDNIQPSREHLSSLTDLDTMYVIARRGTNLKEVQEIGTPSDINHIREVLLGRIFPQAWEVKREPWSLVEWCGDFQMAHRNIWYDIRGFDEWQLGIGLNDSYVLRKTKELGHMTKAVYEVPLWHIDHGKSNDYNDGGTPNDRNCLYEPFRGIVNPETWGFSNIDFEAFRL